ncbi:MAG: carboxynorspermidine decarboxylase [Clostridiales bacterium]
MGQRKLTEGLRGLKLADQVGKLPSPCYVVDEALLIRNLEILQDISRRTGAKILLAQKAFSMFALYPLIGRYLHGATASGLYEAKLAFEEMGKENHIFSPAYLEGEFEEILRVCDHIVFNSFRQWLKFKDKALAAGKECGLRINPEFSTGSHAIYDPCSPGSRLGITRQAFQPQHLEGVSGLHFHTLCEQGAEPLIATVAAVEEKFGPWLKGMKWLNLGGGHHITRAGYDREALIRCIQGLQDKYGLDIYLEPGEAVVLDAGFFVSTVLELVDNSGITNAILDGSAACHMPDVLEMPYRPEIIGAALPGEKAYTYRLGGPTCLAGDIIGDYSFDQPLQEGDRLVFCDMAHYTMVKNNTFNGMALPAIVLQEAGGGHRILRQFCYEDFKGRLS